ncbi:hypothetical protein GOBAR_DD02427 [Gossypium barbadense]|nr:hypothetical protein GOBAR_DD02427 [Gossypium barbadense]
MLKRRRSDILRLNSPLLAIYESLIPPVEEKAKQKQLLALLEKLVCKEWPEAWLYLYGSCENSFEVSKSEIDICLAFNEDIHDKSEILLKLADILQSDNLQNVQANVNEPHDYNLCTLQALTRARVPIVKLMDPVTEISCDMRKQCLGCSKYKASTRLCKDRSNIIPEQHISMAFVVSLFGLL